MAIADAKDFLAGRSAGHIFRIVRAMSWAELGTAAKHALDPVRRAEIGRQHLRLGSRHKPVPLHFALFSFSY